jgi:inner membrane protein
VPTIFSHIAPPLALRFGLGGNTISRPLLIAGLVASVLPDLDVLAFRLNVAYSHVLGHRGFSHSLLFALGLALLALISAPLLRSSRPLAFIFVGLAAVSHPLLDMITNGGLGVALFWPWSAERFFAPWRVIEVSPLSLHRLFGPRGIAVFTSELLWVWLPALLAACLLLFLRRVAEPDAAKESLPRLLTHRPTGILLFALASLWFGACVQSINGNDHAGLQRSIREFSPLFLPALFALGGAVLQKPNHPTAPASATRRWLQTLGIVGCLIAAYVVCTAVIYAIFRMGSRIVYEGDISLSLTTALHAAPYWAIFGGITLALHRWSPGPHSDLLGRAALALIAMSSLLPAFYLLSASPYIHWRT